MRFLLLVILLSSCGLKQVKRTVPPKKEILCKDKMTVKDYKYLLSNLYMRNFMPHNNSSWGNTHSFTIARIENNQLNSYLYGKKIKNRIAFTDMGYITQANFYRYPINKSLGVVSFDNGEIYKVNNSNLTCKIFDHNKINQVLTLFTKKEIITHVLTKDSNLYTIKQLK